ncbi:MAG: YfiR family protein [Fibrobacterales bacterium]
MVRFVNICVCISLLISICFGQKNINEVKAVFIWRLVSYITWPKIDNDSIVFSVYGDCAFNDLLHRLSKNKKMKGRKVNVKSIPYSGMEESDLIFVCSDFNTLQGMIKHWNKKSVLLMGDSPAFTKQGIHINFYVENETVRFELNESALNGAGITVDYRLKKIARLIDSKALEGQ